MKPVAFALLVAGLAAPSALAQQFSDGTFLDSGWSVTKILDTTPASDAIYSAIRGTGGNPGDCRVIAHSWQVVPEGVSISFAHMKSGVEYNPSVSGALSSLFLALDFRCDSAPHVNAIGFGPAIFQGGKWFVAPGSAAIVGQPWLHFEASVPAADWLEVGGNTKPDFSPSGSLIKFGFYTSNGGSGINARVLANGRADNFVARFVRACPSDLNGDAFVDDADFSLFALAYNILDCADPAMAAGCPADLNFDGFVEDSDFSLFALAYNEFLCP